MVAFSLPPIPDKIQEPFVLHQWLFEIVKKIETLVDDVTAVNTIIIEDESVDTTCFICFATDASGSIAVKSGTNILFNSATGLLTVTAINDSAIAETAVTQHEAAIDHDALANFLATEHFLEAAIDHANILNIGTNSHAAIDTHIADATIHFTRPTATTAQLADVGDAINTAAAKELGYQVLNTTTGLTVFASGNADGSDWHFYDSSVAHSPV